MRRCFAAHRIDGPLRRCLLILCAAFFAFTGCGAAHGVSHSRPGSEAELPDVRASAVRLLIADVNAQDDPRATHARALRRLMARYVARTALARRVATTVADMRWRRAAGWTPPRLHAITVGSWGSARRNGRSASVRVVGYMTASRPGIGTLDLPLQRWDVQLRWERGRWRLMDFQMDWLSPAGPMGVPGNEAIKELPERVVFRNRSRSRIGTGAKRHAAR